MARGRQDNAETSAADQKFELWDDSRIKAGSQWKEEIKRAISSAQVAVLLVSKYFLASEFIAKDELPPLLHAAKERGLTVLWVCVGHCLWHLTDIASYQAAHTPPDPLNGLDDNEQDRVIKEICEQILRASDADFRKD